MKIKKIDKNQIPQIVFIAAFLLLLVLPALFINLKKNQTSDYENKMLEEWPEFSMTEEFVKGVYDYVNDRIGFRESSIAVYTEANNALFHSMVNPLFMWGEDGHIYYKDKDYILAYQRLNTDSAYIDSMADFLEQTNDYLDERMAKTDVPYIDPKDVLTAAKGDELLYNRMYDVTHWNDRGAFIGHSLIDAKIREWFDDVKPLDINDYTLKTVHVDTLDNAKFSIDEDVPLYELPDDASADYTELLKPYLDCTTDTFYTHHINPSVENDRRLLVFTDSYFQSHQKFYDNRFKEVYFVHRQNYDYVQYFVNLTFPDMVIFETAERSISSEMPQTSDFSEARYEPPYTGEYDFAENPGVTYDITSVKGGRVEGDRIYLDPEDMTAIFTIDAVLHKPEGMGMVDVYAKTDDECMETEYLKLYRQMKEEGCDRFSVFIQRRFMTQSQIQLFAVSPADGRPFLLETFEVLYDE